MTYRNDWPRSGSPNMNNPDTGLLDERVRLAERHIAVLLVALDASHTLHGCACPHGHGALAHTWVPAGVRRPGQPAAHNGKGLGGAQA